MGELPIRSKITSCISAATTTTFQPGHQGVTILCSCSTATAALHEAEENTTDLTVFYTDFHFRLNSGYFGLVAAELFQMLQIRVPIKTPVSFVVVNMVRTRPSTADIQAIIMFRHAGFALRW